MGAQILFALFFLLALSQTAGGSLVLDATPTDICPGLTQSLAINCTFSFDGVSDIVDIIALIIAKQNNQEQFDDLVSITIFTPNQIMETAQLNGSRVVSGRISPDDRSFLSIRWSSPTTLESGYYRCELSGVNSFGRPAQFSQTIMVTSQNPSLDQLTNTQHYLDGQDTLTLMQHFQHQLDRISILMSNQSQTMDLLLSLVQGQSAKISSQSYTITEIQNKLDSHMILAKNNEAFSISTEYQGHYYLLSKEGVENSTHAEQTCESYGGYLVEINDSDEKDFVKGFLRTLDGFYTVLISGTKDVDHGTWNYTYKGGLITYTDWRPGQPLKNSWPCICMAKGHYWQWYTSGCTNIFSSTYRYMCEVSIN